MPLKIAVVQQHSVPGAVEKIADWTGLGKVLIGAPVFIYTVRVLSATFVAIGVFLLILPMFPGLLLAFVPFQSRLWMMLIPDQEESMTHWHRNKKGISADIRKPEGAHLRRSVKA